nr:MAG TPA: hypothetical protein [Caudoviricetes sp.]
MFHACKHRLCIYHILTSFPACCTMQFYIYHMVTFLSIALCNYFFFFYCIVQNFVVIYCTQ